MTEKLRWQVSKTLADPYRIRILGKQEALAKMLQSNGKSAAATELETQKGFQISVLFFKQWPYFVILQLNEYIWAPFTSSPPTGFLIYVIVTYAKKGCFLLHMIFPLPVVDSQHYGFYSSPSQKEVRGS